MSRERDDANDDDGANAAEDEVRRLAARTRDRRANGRRRMRKNDDCDWTDGACLRAQSDDAREDARTDDEEDADVDAVTGNYFGRAAKAPPAPEGANPFAASAATPTDDVDAMIERAKAQVEAQRAKREIEEAKDRERERRAFEDQGREYVARRKPGEASESPASGAGTRRKVVKAKRPGQSPLSGTGDGGKTTTNAFAGFAALAGGAKREDADAGRSSVFSRLSGAPVDADDDDDAGEAKAEKTKPAGLFSFPTAAPSTSAEPAKAATFGFSAPPPLTKDNLHTQRTAKIKLTESDDDDDDARKSAPAPPPTALTNAPPAKAVKKVKTALAIELGL